MEITQQRNVKSLLGQDLSTSFVTSSDEGLASNLHKTCATSENFSGGGGGGGWAGKLLKCGVTGFAPGRRDVELLTWARG